jgi:hypothetical protein
MWERGEGRGEKGEGRREIGFYIINQKCSQQFNLNPPNLTSRAGMREFN